MATDRKRARQKQAEHERTARRQQKQLVIAEATRKV